MLVTEVPMLAPMTIGIALANGIMPDATRRTISEVVVDDDCTIEVASIPIIKARTGFSVD